MADYQLLSELLRLPNVKVVSCEMVNDDRIEVFIESNLEAAVCPHCQAISMRVHDTAEPQMIRDLPMWDCRCWLRYAPRRFACARCQKTFVERVAWREGGVAYTLRYAQQVYQHTRRENIAQIAQDEGLSEDTVQSIFERGAKKRWRKGDTRR
jgi:transposase